MRRDLIFPWVDLDDTSRLNRLIESSENFIVTDGDMCIYCKERYQTCVLYNPHTDMCIVDGSFDDSNDRCKAMHELFLSRVTDRKNAKEKELEREIENLCKERTKRLEYIETLEKIIYCQFDEVYGE